MKTTLKLLILLLIMNSTSLFAATVSNAYAIGIFDEHGQGENIQHVRTTKNDYNDICFTKIVVFGRLLGETPDVKIGNAKGHFLKSIPVYNDKKIKIANELTFKHYAVSKGYLQIKISKKLYDTKVFVK